MNYTLTKSDLEELEVLKRICETIYEEYGDLRYLEEKGKLGTEEFQTKISCLKSTISLADNIFDGLSTDFSRNKAFIYFLYEQIKKEIPSFPNLSYNDYPIINYYDFGKNVTLIGRILNRFSAKCIEDKEGLTKETLRLMQVDSNILDNCDEEEKESIIEIVNAIPAYNFYLASDMQALELSILTCHTEKANSEFKTKIKYESCFMLENLERIYLGNGFNADVHPYLINSCVKKMHNLSDSVVTKSKSEWMISNFQSIANRFLYAIDHQNSDSIFFYQSYIRSILVLAGDEVLSELFKQAQNLSSTSAASQMAKNCFLSAFDYVKEDKYIPQILSLGL